MNEKIFSETNVGELIGCKFEDKETLEEIIVMEPKEDGEGVEDYIAKCQEIADEHLSDTTFVEIIDKTTVERLNS